MVLIANPTHLTTGKASYKLVQSQGRDKVAPQPSKGKMSKEQVKSIQGEGFAELTSKLSAMKMKDVCKDIRITM